MRFDIMEMKPAIPVFDTIMGICQLRHGAYAERHKFEFWLWALVVIFATLASDSATPYLHPSRIPITELLDLAV